MNQKLMKIAVPVLILAVIAGIWFVKNSAGKDADLAKTKHAKQMETEEKETSDKKEDSKEKKAGSEQSASKEGETKKTEADFTFQFTKELDFEALKSFGLPIIADYGSENCSPCRMMHPDLEAIHGEYEGKAFIKYADVWDDRDTTNNVPIRVTPTQVLFTAEGKPYVPSEEAIRVMGANSFTSYNDKETGEHVLTVHEGMLNQEQMRFLLTEMGVKQ